MKRLQDNGLFGDRLVLVNTTEMVRRYNECLTAIGVKPTELSEFHIDGIGWSPEISLEKGRIKYFTLGEANQFGIVLTPDQRGLPIYTPFNSFDRDVMEEFFKKANAQVVDMTTQTGLWLDCAHDLMEYSSPVDLLMVESILVRTFDVAGMMDTANKQRELVAQFRGSEDLWQDPVFRKRIRESAIRFGDLRFRAINIPDLPFTDLRCFYTRAFGGVYVFRDIAKGKPLLVLEDKAHKLNFDRDAKVFMINDANLISTLLDEGIVAAPITYYKKNIDALELIRYFAIVNAFYSCKENADINFDSLTSARQKNWITDHMAELPQWFSEICRVISMLRSGSPIKDIKLTRKLEEILIMPCKKVAESKPANQVTMQLIARLHPGDIERLYLYNRILFYDLYRSWPEGKKQWCVEYLKRCGHPHHINGKDKTKKS